MKKIVFITAHNWETKRQGGFHKFAEASCMAGYETVFFSFPRAYYGFFLKREQLNTKIIKTLQKGITYNLDESHSILNVTFPTFRLPNAFDRFVPGGLMNWLLRHSFSSFKNFARRYFSDTECFVFESCEGVAYVDILKKLYPNARIVYRPSDPMVYAGVPNRIKKLEQNILNNADMTLLVNKESLESYTKWIPDFETRIPHIILPNGIDIEAYKKTYPVPEQLKDKTSILYVGACEVDWPLLYKAASVHPKYDYIVVCPNYPSPSVLKKVETIPNLTYIPGIKPDEVPVWMTNCSVVMVPYQTGYYDDWALSITAKYYKAMAAKKPIVAYAAPKQLMEFGIPVTYTYDDFINEVEKAVSLKSFSYSFDLEGREWSVICKSFLEACQK